MTTEKKNTLMQNLQMAIISIGTTAGVGCFVFLWQIHGFVSMQQQINKDNDQIQTNISNRVSVLEERSNNHETRISILEQKANEK
jgi:hypothetical protein